jgi:small subunit ribosomal protein S1
VTDATLSSMSSPSESNPSEAPASESSETSQQASETSQQAEARRASGIRIGTQRYGSKPPAAVARPILPAPPAELLAKAAALSVQPAPPADLPPPEQPAGSAAPAAEASPGPAAPTSPAPQRGGGEGRRGDRDDRPRKRERKPEAPKPVPDRVPHTVAPPNIRAELPPELELEYMAALGGESLEDIITTRSAGTIAELEPESRHRAKVLTVHRDNVFVEIAGQHQGSLPLRSFANPPEPGTILEVQVSRYNAPDGFYELTLPGGAVDVGDWSEVSEGLVVEARVTGHNKGGLECEVSKLRGFIPASQVSLYRVEDLSQFVGQTLNCVITEANPEKRNLVLSHRAVLERDKAEAKEKLLATLEVGQVREATVRSLQDFGAFVDLGGVDGLIHISQLSWDRIKHASEVLEIGQKVKVKIQKIDPQTGKIGLAFRDLAENPWANAARDFPARSRVKGRVSRLMDFGAFVRLAPGVEGLVHISELSHKRVFRVSDVLAEGQEVEVQVQSVDPEAQRISLSLKALEARAEAPKAEPEPEELEVPAAPPKPRKTPLKGGIGGPSTGEKFGLKW